MNKTACKNCEHSFEGNFCNKCGQSSHINRINYKYLAEEISNNIFQVNRGFFYTIRELFIRPGHTINNFIEGKRKEYFKPLAYILMTSTLYLLIAFFLDIDTTSNEITSGFIIGINNNGNEKDSGIITALYWLTKHQAYAVLLTLPFFSLGSYIAFFKLRYNYFEHLILNIYITGQQMIIYLLLSFIVVLNSSAEFIPLAVGVFYNFWAYYSFFKTKSSFTKILLSLLTYALFMLQLFALLIIGVLLIDKLNL